MNQKQEHFQDILQSFNTAMLTTIGDDGKPRSRPMRIAETCEDNVLWFVTSAESGKIEEVAINDKVAITMQGGGKFLSLTGVGKVVTDQSKMDEIWSDTWKIWFPEGKNDPSIVLLKIEPQEGEYWDMSGTNRIRFMYEAGKAYFSGEEIDTSMMDSNAKVNL
jgi:general stress protein 26